jgi:hypothetical protein
MRDDRRSSRGALVIRRVNQGGPEGGVRQHGYQALLLLGPPGSSKSTQGKVLALLPGIHYWEAGEALRSPAEVLDQILHVLIPLLNSRREASTPEPPITCGLATVP